MSKAIPKKRWPDVGRLCWIEWRDACDVRSTDDSGELATAYTFGLFIGVKYQDVRGKKRRVLVVAYNWFDTPEMDKMNVPASEVVRWGYGAVPKRVME